MEPIRRDSAECTECNASRARNMESECRLQLQKNLLSAELISWERAVVQSVVEGIANETIGRLMQLESTVAENIEQKITSPWSTMRLTYVI